MPKKPTEPDFNQRAKQIVDAITAQVQPEPTGKNPFAQALGRLGGLKGGDARAKALTKTRRSEIAKKAAQTRWKSAKKTAGKKGAK